MGTSTLSASFERRRRRSAHEPQLKHKTRCSCAARQRLLLVTQLPRNRRVSVAAARRCLLLVLVICEDRSVEVGRGLREALEEGARLSAQFAIAARALMQLLHFISRRMFPPIVILWILGSSSAAPCLLSFHLPFTPYLFYFCYCTACYSFLVAFLSRASFLPITMRSSTAPSFKFRLRSMKSTTSVRNTL